MRQLSELYGTVLRYAASHKVLSSRAQHTRKKTGTRHLFRLSFATFTYTSDCVKRAQNETHGLAADCGPRRRTPDVRVGGKSSASPDAHARRPIATRCHRDLSRRSGCVRVAEGRQETQRTSPHTQCQGGAISARDRYFFARLTARLARKCLSLVCALVWTHYRCAISLRSRYAFTRSLRAR